MSGQSVIDRLNAAKHSLSGQGLAKAICKASTEEVIGPKRKHIDYLLQCTHEANVSVPQMADLLIQRTQINNWVVVFKSLVTVHNIMNYGNERFYQYLASNNCAFHLDNFIDKSHVQGYDMSTYIRKYAKYLNEKAMAYRVMAFDFCKVKRGKDDGLLRTMAAEKLLKALPVLQAQIDALLEFDPTLNELNNGVINAAFLLLFKDLIRLFACYNDGIINLLEKYFDLNRKQCKEGLEIYKKFLVRMDKTAEFLKVAENVGIDKGDIPDLTKAPASLLEALEGHLSSLEGKKASKLQSKTAGKPAAGLSEDEKKRILAEEEQQLQKLKEQKMKAHATAASMEPLSKVPTQTTEVIPPVAAAIQQPEPARVAPSDDLLALDTSPFQSNMNSILSLSANQPSAGQQWTAQPALSPQNGHNTSGFISDTSFASAFATPQPANNTGDLFGQVLQPHSTAPAIGNQPAPQQKLVQNDLDSSLASLAGNLSVNPGAQAKSSLQWTAPTEKKLTGGNTFSGIRPAASTWTQPQPNMMAQPAYSQQPMYYPQQNSMLPQQGQMYFPQGVGMRPMAPPAYQPQPAMAPSGFPVQPMMAQQPPASNQQTNFDPFGAL